MLCALFLAANSFSEDALGHGAPANGYLREDASAGGSLVEEPMPKVYPIELNRRPLTLPADTWGISSMLGFYNDLDHGFINVGGSYGVMDELQIGFLTHKGIEFMPEFKVPNSLVVGVDYALYSEGDWDISTGLDLPLSFRKEAEFIPYLSFDFYSRYKLLGSRLAIRTGSGFLKFDFSGDFGMTLNLPIGLSYQANETFNVAVLTHLLTISLGGDGEVVSIVDRTPLNIYFNFALGNNLDIGAGLMTDLQNSGNTTIIISSIRYRAL